MTFIKVWVRNIVVFLLISSIAGQIVPDEKYKKYIRLTTGLLMIIVMIEPVMQVLTLKPSLYETILREAFTFENIGDPENTKASVEQYKQMIGREVQYYFEEESMSTVYCLIEIDTEASREGYGSIQEMKIGLVSGISRETALNNKESEAIRVENVYVGADRQEISEETSVSQGKIDGWKDALSLQFGVDQSKIELVVL